MAYLSAYEYYQNNGNSPQDANLGSYQYISLEDIVTNFLLMHTGDNSLINNEPRFKTLFHAKQAIKELNFDAFKEVKALELNVSENLRYKLPHDYVNWVRISLYKDGVLYPLNENVQLNSSNAYLQDNSGNILFDSAGNILEPQFSNIDIDRIRGTQQSIYLDGGQFNGMSGYNFGGEWYFDMQIGGRYGLNTSTANANPTFRIDNKKGVINFSSSIGDNLVILEYVCDGMEAGDNTLITVNKLFEKYIYKEIEYQILSSKLNVQEYVIRRIKKERNALLGNSRIRISGIHPGRLLMNLRGQNKQLK